MGKNYPVTYYFFEQIMRVLIFGDVFGRPGRTAILDRIQDLREQYAADLTILNGENVAGGSSITQPIAEQFFQNGIDVITGGNHSFDKPESVIYLDKQPRVLRPANYPPGTPGKGLFIGETKSGVPFAVMNYIGRVFMAPNAGDPFRAADEAVKSIPEDVKVRIVDMHAEATSEKYAMGWFLDGRVSLVYGTHSHVPTSDERILTNGTAYITDIGMTGSYAGVIGMNKEDVIWRFTRVPGKRAGHAEGDIWICAIVLEIDEETGRANSIERIKLTHVP
jgi:metallophosphoesterase (TIGR00282 family)